jgi:hypothetical protein
VTVVVLAVNFMGAFFVGSTDDLLQYGAGIALPIAALGLFVGLRAWAANSTKGRTSRESRHVGVTARHAATASEQADQVMPRPQDGD